MKKLLSAAVAVLALALAFTGCSQGPETSSVQPVEIKKAEITEISINANMPYNYQTAIEWYTSENDYAFKEGDSITFKITGVPDADIPLYKAFLVDNDGGWTMLSSYTNGDKGGVKDTEDTVTFNITLTADASSEAPAACKLAIYYDKFDDDVVPVEATETEPAVEGDFKHASKIAVSSFEVTTTAKKGPKPAVQEVTVAEDVEINLADLKFAAISWKEGYVKAQSVISNWGTKTYNCTETSKLVCEYETAVPGVNLSLIVNSGEDGTGWVDAYDWSTPGKVTIDLSEKAGKTFSWIATEVILPEAETYTGKVTIKNITFTK